VRTLLLGANGQLGLTFLEQGGLAARGELVAASRDGTLTQGGHGEIADLSSPASLPTLLDRVRPELVVNAAAYTAVDRAEQEEALATRVNGEAVGVLGRWAAAHGALVIHYSTDYVFDGLQAQPYAVNAPTAPLSAYGRSKLAGELALRGSGADHLIFRTAWVYAAHGHNFLRTMLRLGAERDELRVVADQYGAPTDTMLIVEATLAALDRWTPADAAQRQVLTGTYHLVASGATTWHGFASAIINEAAVLGLLTHPPLVLAVGSSEFQTQAVRPTWSLLDNTGFRRHFNFTLPDWQHGLHDVMREIRNTQLQA
jgi:dTDP-4-dehydrorhamnose reductase